MPVRMGVAVAGDGARLCLVHVYSVRFSVVEARRPAVRLDSMTNDEAMGRALALAQQAAVEGDVPVGAVVLDAEGRVIGEGTLVAVDVWGRATVRLANGAQELEIAPEQARLRYV